MPRIRTIKPDYFVYEDIGRLNPICRQVFQGLWCHADKAGRLEYRPDYLKTQIIPYDKEDIVEMLEILMKPKVRTGIPFILKYEVEGIPFIQIIAWNKHQKTHPTESESRLPEPPKEVMEQLFNGRINVKERLTNGEATDGKDRIGKDRVVDSGAPPVVEAVIRYLNKQAETSFEPTNKEWVGLISARLRDGYTTEDFQKVIDLKVQQWGKDERMAKFLRPSTLFSKNHMEEYLNEVNRRPKQRGE